MHVRYGNIWSTEKTRSQVWHINRKNQRTDYAWRVGCVQYERAAAIHIRRDCDRGDPPLTLSHSLLPPPHPGSCEVGRIHSMKKLWSPSNVVSREHNLKLILKMIVKPLRSKRQARQCTAGTRDVYPCYYVTVYT